MDITCVGVTKMVFRPTVLNQPEFKCLFFLVFLFSRELIYPELRLTIITKHLACILSSPKAVEIYFGRHGNENFPN
jgi:hypothetical protein